MAVNKQSFYENINQDTVFDEVIFKKVLGYAWYDKPFLEAVTAKLTEIGRKDVVEQYNTWHSAWKANDDQEMKKAAELYHKECDRRFERWQKEQGKVMNEWEAKKIELLTRKKQLLSLLKSIDN